LQSRQELAQQLAVSRDLTQKIKIDSSSDDEEEEENNDEKVVPADSDNPWIAPKTSTEVDEFVSAYRKYWEEHNKKSLGQNGTVNNNTSHNEGTEEREVENEVKKGHPWNRETACADRNFESENDKGTPADNIHLGSHTSESLSAGGEDNQDGLIAADVPVSEEVNSNTQVQQERKNVSQNKPVIIAEQLNSNKKKTKFGISSDSCMYKPFESHPVVIATTNSWVVTPIDVEVGTVDEVNGLGGKKNKRNKRKSVESRAVKSKVKVGELFDEMEEKLKEKVGTKLKKLKVNLKVKDENKTEETNSESDNEGPSLKLKQMHVRPHLDEELVEQPHDKVQEEGSLNLNLRKIVAESRVQEDVQKPPVDSIDPNKFIAMKPRHLQTELPDMVTRDEALDDSEDESTERQMTITEAFAEDDVVAEFR